MRHSSKNNTTLKTSIKHKANAYIQSTPPGFSLPDTEMKSNPVVPVVRDREWLSSAGSRGLEYQRYYRSRCRSIIAAEGDVSAWQWTYLLACLSCFSFMNDPQNESPLKMPSCKNNRKKRAEEKVLMFTDILFLKGALIKGKTEQFVKLVAFKILLLLNKVTENTGCFHRLPPAQGVGKWQNLIFKA